MNRTYTSSQLREIAKYQRLVLWSVLANLLSIFVISIQGLGVLISIALAVFQIYSLYKLANSLKESTVSIALFIIGLFIPLVGLLVLLYINSKATKALQNAGIKVGLMGANPDDIRG